MHVRKCSFLHFVAGMFSGSVFEEVDTVNTSQYVVKCPHHFGVLSFEGMSRAQCHFTDLFYLG